MKERDSAAAELTSSLAIIVVLTGTAIIMMVFITGQFPPDIPPSTQLTIWYDGNSLYIQSTGGDVLQKGDYSIKTDEGTYPGDINLTPGSILNKTVPRPQKVLVIAKTRNNHEFVLYEKNMTRDEIYGRP